MEIVFTILRNAIILFIGLFFLLVAITKFGEWLANWARRRLEKLERELEKLEKEKKEQNEGNSEGPL